MWQGYYLKQKQKQSQKQNNNNKKIPHTHTPTCKYLRTRTLTFYLAARTHTPEINWHTVDLIHTHWTLTIRPWTVLYPSKRGTVLNMFLCYLRSPGHNRKTRTCSFGSVALFPLLFTHTRPHFQVFTNAHTPPTHTHPHAQNKTKTSEKLCVTWPWYPLPENHYWKKNSHFDNLILETIKPN